MFFIADAIYDVAVEGSVDLLHHVAETAAALALVVGVFLTAREIRRVLARQRRMAEQLRVAAGAFHGLLEEKFAAWGLTPSERDVALLAIKGLSIAEIAAARSTAEGTVKAQNAAIYAKAGVSGRLQLLSLFIDELMDGRAAGDHVG